MESVEVPWPLEVRVTDELLREVLGPALDETVTERVIVPENPLRLVRVIVDAADVPFEKLSDDGLAAMLKSPELIVFIVTVMVV
jgi:hypothetical protein